MVDVGKLAPLPEGFWEIMDRHEYQARIGMSKLTAEIAEAMDELAKWWMKVAEDEIEAVVPKAVEYGATDLYEIGRTMAEAMHQPLMTNAQYAELGCFFYICGKFARWSAAIKEGRRVSDDTLHDIGIYIKMVQRIRVAGGWPGKDSR